MKDLMKHLDILISRYPVLEESRQDIEKAYLVLEECYGEKKKVLIAGNGRVGSRCGAYCRGIDEGI